MNLPNTKRFSRLIDLVKSVNEMPRVNITFRKSSGVSATVAKSKSTYRTFTQRHRYLVTRKKTIGIALIDLRNFDNFASYLKSIDGKNSAAYYSRKAKKRSYSFAQIDRNAYTDDIHEINTSAEYRQGRKMTDSYMVQTKNFESLPGYTYFGVTNNDGKLVAYCNVTNYGEFALIPQLLGHKAHLNDGVMYYMLTEVVGYFYNSQHEIDCRYLMYDTMVGVTGGLQKFKIKLGFQPYRVKWIWGHDASA